MRVIPVLDVQGGVVVRGVAGRREEYRPIVSRLTPSTRPLDIARAFRDQFGLTELYLADLDALAGGPPAWDLYASLRADGFRMLVDAGIRHGTEGVKLAEAGIEKVIAGLETLAGPATLSELCRRVDPRRIIFSLDLKDGRPLGNLEGWQAADALAIVSRAITCGARRILVLDLARIGLGGGPGTEDLCDRILRAFPDVEVVAGGGIRHRADLERFRSCGVAGVLVASALHDGTISRTDFQAGCLPATPAGNA